ncbi:LysR substrate-binding domain-containing protein [Labrenzia sp. OB1]|uniref:LysR substrate-binding domain-containing protein n=1 Tax=Labrenzia sp. OB1 TaxID=1561204 RepID=UPI0007B243E3|nr:LysR substrate-binding domain-containing protein [Labrenzia sp. OB1]KZM49557.1 hypothetical protein OA90_13815 [Labrenzia sp. OB1]
MARALNLRQIEIFKAVMEYGTVSQAADVLNISQPAASKLLMQLERENGLQLFSRQKGRLVPTTQSLHLYDEVERIFAGVRQVESAIALIRREDQGRIVVGLPPALTGAFIQRAIASFLDRNPNVLCLIQSRRSRWLVEHLVTRQVDVSITPTPIENSNFATERIVKHPLVCIMPPSHPLEQKKVVLPDDLNDIEFITFDLDSYTGQKIDTIFQKYSISPKTVINADSVASIREFVAGGQGVALVYPLFIAGMGDRLSIRPFEPETPMEQFLSYAHDARNKRLIQEFATDAKAACNYFIENKKMDWVK